MFFGACTTTSDRIRMHRMYARREREASSSNQFYVVVAAAIVYSASASALRVLDRASASDFGLLGRCSDTIPAECTLHLLYFTFFCICTICA
jgi:hypothetical protein